MRKNIRAVAAVIEKDGEFLIARRMDGSQNGYWEFPGGKYEEGETGEQAIIREIREEFSMEITVTDFLCTISHRYPEFDLEMDCYRCHIKEGEPVLNEHSAIKWVTGDVEGIRWLPADRKVIRAYKEFLENSRI